jgi:hypothetical protein
MAEDFPVPPHGVAPKREWHIPLYVNIKLDHLRQISGVLRYNSNNGDY